MTTGRILQFDSVRGYGFVAADDGGEDVFLHASVFSGDPDMLVPGMKVKFQTMAGDRGRKAFAVHLVAEESDPEDQLARPVPAPPRAALAPPVAAPPGAVPALPAQTSPAPVPVPPVPAPSVSAPSAQELAVPDEEQMCDVLSAPEFRQELTELLLNTLPELTGHQINQARQGMLEFAKKHGWIDG